MAQEPQYVKTRRLAVTCNVSVCFFLELCTDLTELNNWWG